MTYTDENGFPTAGSVSLNGLETPEIASQGMIRNTLILDHSVKNGKAEKPSSTIPTT